MIRALRVWWYAEGSIYFQMTVGEIIDLVLAEEDPAEPAGEFEPVLRTTRKPGNGGFWPKAIERLDTAETLACALTVGFQKEGIRRWWKSHFCTMSAAGMIYRAGGKPFMMISPSGQLHVWS